MPNLTDFGFCTIILQRLDDPFLRSSTRRSDCRCFVFGVPWRNCHYEAELKSPCKATAVAEVCFVFNNLELNLLKGFPRMLPPITRESIGDQIVGHWYISRSNVVHGATVSTLNVAKSRATSSIMDLGSYACRGLCSNGSSLMKARAPAARDAKAPDRQRGGIAASYPDFGGSQGAAKGRKSRCPTSCTAASITRTRCGGYCN
eukprot:4375235-Amphidinium_carterae.1